MPSFNHANFLAHKPIWPKVGEKISKKISFYSNQLNSVSQSMKERFVSKGIVKRFYSKERLEPKNLFMVAAL